MKKASIGIVAVMAALLVLAVAFSLNITGGIMSVKASGVELCNGLDDDGDGVVDDYNDPLWGNLELGQACNGIGECGLGLVECKPITNEVDCWSNPGGSKDQSVPEMCDSLDNDCDSSIDEDFSYNDPQWGTLFVGQACNGIGECGLGLVECFNPNTASCWTNPGGTQEQNTTETCNGLDDDCDNETDEGSVCDIVSITLHGYPIDFSSLDPGTNDNPAAGNDLNLYNITVEPETTVNVDLYQNGTDFTDGGNVLEIGNMTWSTTNNAEASLPVNGTYDSNYPIATNVSADTNITVYYWLDVPGGKTAGSYTATINIKAVETGGLP